MPDSILFDVLVWSTLILGAGLLLLLVIASLTGLYMYLVDQHQTRNSIRRNYPLLGRFRFVLEMISRPAVRALSIGAAHAGCWLNTQPHASRSES